MTNTINAKCENDYEVLIPTHEIMAGRNEVRLPDGNTVYISGAYFEGWSVKQIGFKFYVVLPKSLFDAMLEEAA